VTKAQSLADPPVLTADGFRRLAAQLDTDLLAVAGSGTSDDIKKQTRRVIGVIQPLLRAVADNFPDDVGGWVPGLGAMFTELSANMKAALGAAAVTGACHYTSRQGPQCWQTTDIQCATVGGTFVPGGIC
jgi:hypothetical protein